MRKLLILFFLADAFAADAQDFGTLWSRAWEPLYTDCYDVKIDVTVFRNAYKIAELKKDNMRYRKCNGSMAITSGDYEQLITPEVTIIADNMDKVLMVTPTLDKEAIQPKIPLDSLVKLGQASFSTWPDGVKDQTVKGLTGYIFVNPTEQLSRVEFWFRTDSRQVSRILVCPSATSPEELMETPAIEYQFAFLTTQPDVSFLKISRFGTRKNHSFSPSPAYRNYNVLSQL